MSARVAASTSTGSGRGGHHHFNQTETLPDTEYCDGTGPILSGRQLPPGALALPSPHPLAVDSPKSRRQGVLGPSCRPWARPEACVIVAHDAETGEELWRRRLVPAPRPARRRDLGRHALREPRSRGVVDGPQRRPRPESRLRRHVRHLVGPDVPAGRHRDRLVLDADRKRHNKNGRF